MLAELLQLLLDELHNVSVDLLLQCACLLQSAHSATDIIVNERINLVATVPNVLQVHKVGAHLLSEARFNAYQEVGLLKEALDVRHQILRYVVNVLQLVGHKRFE